MKNERSNTGNLILILAIVAGTVSSVSAAQLVTFNRGQAIVVESVDHRDDWYYLTLEGGGEMGVPASLVARIENYEVPPPSAAAAATGYTTPPAASSTPAAGPGMANPPAGPSPSPVANGTAGPSPSPAANGSSNPAENPAAANVMAQSDDWRYKVRMSGGPRQLGPMDRSSTIRQGIRPGGPRLPGRGPGGQRNQPATPVPPPQ